MSTIKVLEYKGFQGSVEFSVEDGVIHGKVLHINDLISYDADTLPALISAFEEAVDDYVETCAEIGKSPEKPFSGTFNVRIGPALHKAAARAAAREDKTMNEFVREAVDCHVNGRHQEIHHHYAAHADYSGEYMIQGKPKRPTVQLRVVGGLQ